jgi:AraC-like DNA-binding protein
MKSAEETPLRYNSLSETHQAMGLPKPVHPLISLIDGINNKITIKGSNVSRLTTLYKISYTTKTKGKMQYGQGYYDFDEGGLLFAAPNQLIGGKTDDTVLSGYTLLVHPDFLWNYPLAKKIRQYGFFSYSANETLHLSDVERNIIVSIFKNIQLELEGRIDDFSQDVIISQIELLLTYSNRFYKRQFTTRKTVNAQLLEKLEEVFEQYFKEELPLQKGLPTVTYLAESLSMSPSYLSDMLRSLIGQNATQFIHAKLIEYAKEQLSGTGQSVNEIAYSLGFEHAQSFSKLFKSKTKLTPLEFRRSFN